MNGSPKVELGRYLSPERVVRIDAPIDKHELLTRLIRLTVANPLITDKAGFAKAIYDREDVTSTGIGGGVAVPHARLASISGFVISIGIVPRGVEFAAQDHRPVLVAVMIAATDQDRQTYLKVLASVAARLKVPNLVDDLVRTRDPEAAIALFAGRETAGS